jgi:hypothetical protein
LLTVERDGQACAPVEENIILRLFLRALTAHVDMPEEPSDRGRGLLRVTSREAGGR